MLQNPCKTLGFKKNMVYKIPPGGGGKPYPASGLYRPIWLWAEIDMGQNCYWPKMSSDLNSYTANLNLWLRNLGIRFPNQGQYIRYIAI